MFKFVMLNAIIDDLICHKMPATLALKEAKIAIQNLLPYALNLCRSPNRKEYKTVKVRVERYYLLRFDALLYMVTKRIRNIFQRLFI